MPAGGTVRDDKTGLRRRGRKDGATRAVWCNTINARAGAHVPYTPALRAADAATKKAGTQYSAPATFVTLLDFGRARVYRTRTMPPAFFCCATDASQRVLANTYLALTCL